MAAEREAMFQPAFFGVHEGGGNAIGAVLHIARRDAMVWAGKRHFIPLRDIFEKGVADRPSRQPDRAFNNHDVFFFRVNVRLFEGDVRVAFVRRHEARPHLDARRAHLQEFVDVRAGINAACGDNGNGAAVLRFERLHGRDDFGNKVFQRESRIVDLL